MVSFACAADIPGVVRSIAFMPGTARAWSGTRVRTAGWRGTLEAFGRQLGVRMFLAGGRSVSGSTGELSQCAFPRDLTRR
jgi:hypothetical protein